MAERTGIGLGRQRQRLNGFLLLAVVCLTWGLYLAKSPQGATSVTGLAQDELHYLSLDRADGIPFSLERVDGAWNLAVPGFAAVAPIAVADLVAAATAESQGSHARTAIDSARAGLDSPRISLEINHHLRIEFGDRAPISGLRYARLGDTVHLVSDRHFDSVNQPLERILDQRIVPAHSRVEEIRIPGASLGAGDGEQSVQILRAWESAEATAIGRLHPTAPAGVRIELRTSTPKRSMELELIRSPQADGLFVARRDLEIGYHFAPDRMPPTDFLQKP